MRSPACSDEQLMARVQADDIDALGELYERYCGAAYRLALSVSHDRGRAEDAVQEAFVSIWRSRATYNGGQNPVASWLLTVVRHRAVDVGRRNDKHASRSAGDGRLERHPSQQDVAVEVEETAGAESLRCLLAQLPHTQREVITLAFYGQMTHAEIAEHLDLPSGTVKGRMRLGLEKLRASVTAEMVA